MKLTNHFIQRMKQRNINQDMILIANMFGEPSNKGERIVLKRKSIHRLIKSLEALERRGGITIVDDQNTLITTYFNDSFNRNIKSDNDFNFS